MCGDMISWLSDHGVETKIEDDGRVFPNSNSSQTIIDCFQNLIRKYRITVQTKTGVDSFKKENDIWQIQTSQGDFSAKKLIIATGSNRKIWDMLSASGHTISPPVPSLFTFKIKHELLSELPGLSVPNGITNIKGEKREESGPILITHKGLSGPGILKLSAWEAVLLAEKNYKFALIVNWIAEDYKELLAHFKNLRDNEPKTKFISLNQKYNLPQRLWKKMISICNLEMKNFAEASNKNIEQLAKILAACELEVDGKNTNKDEFLTHNFL